MTTSAGLGTTKRWMAVSSGPVRAITALSVLITATNVAQALLIAQVFTRLLGGGSASSGVSSLIVIALLVAVRSVLLWARESQAAEAAGAAKAQLRAAVYEKLLALGPGWVRSQRTGALQTTLVDSIETLDAFVGRFVPQAIAGLLSAAAIAAYIFVLDPIVGAIVLVCGLVVPIVPQLSRRLLTRRMDPWMAAYRGLYAENLDALQGMLTLTVFGASGQRGRELDARANSFSKDSIRLSGIVVAYVGVVGIAVGAGTALAVGVGALRRASGILSTGELFAILLLTRECFRPLRDLEHAFHAAYPAFSVAHDLTAFLATEVPVNDVPSPVTSARHPSWAAARADGALPKVMAPSLDFDRITFRYPGRDVLVLDGFSLRIAAGEHVAIVGRSGAGKTTIVGLLLRWFDPNSGTIGIDGTPTTGIALDILRSNIAVVSQDTYLFHRSVRDNLLLGRASASDSELREALGTAQAQAFVDDLPSGLDTVIGERGMTLSGGQRQRISIARALLQDAPVLVLDEATSSMDATNERSVVDGLDSLTEGRTTITIAHRLSTVRAADRIAVLDAGRVVESGHHDDLIVARGPFAALVAAQEAAR